MSQPVYKLFYGRRTQAGYQLSSEEEQKLFARLQEALAKVGGKSIVLCDSNWASEQWTFWGVEQYPDLEALQAHTKLLDEFKWFQYIESRTLLGTEAQMG
jgi:hypothetical protein